MSKTWNRALTLVMSISGNIQQMFYAFPVYHMGNIVIISDSTYEIIT